MTRSRSLATAAFCLSLGGFLISAVLFALIYFECLVSVEYIWVAASILLTQLPALALSIPVRKYSMGRAGLALSSSILVAMIVVLLFVLPVSRSTTSVGRGTSDVTSEGAVTCRVIPWLKSSAFLPSLDSVLSQARNPFGGAGHHA